MRIGVISDSHDNKDNIIRAFRKLEESGIKTVIHLGDLISPFVIDWINEYYTGTLIFVKGNNDGELAFTLRKIQKYGYVYYEDPGIIEIDGKRIAIMHKPLFIEEIAASNKVDFVLYGHTHKREIKRVGNTLIVNPGELCGYLSGKGSYVILDLKAGGTIIEWT